MPAEESRSPDADAAAATAAPEAVGGGNRPGARPLAAGRPAEAAGQGPRWRAVERALILAAVAVVVWFQYATVSAMNGFGDWGDYDYYRLLVRGWQKGQLHLDKAPPPELLALADPYDPAENGPYRLPDASYFRGRYHLYSGAAPAFVLMLPYTWLTGAEMTTGAAVFVFCTVAFLAAAALWLAIRRRYFPQSAVWTAPLGVLVLGFGTHLLALTSRPMWWELPIAAGVAFCLLALGGVYAAVHGRWPILSMSAAGLGVGLAIASRPTCLFAVPLLLVPVWLRRRESAGRDASPPPPYSPTGRALALAALVPPGLCLAAMLAHNHARFEHPLEFGQNYQLSGAYEGQLQHFSLRFLPHTWSVYLFQPLKWTWEFPFAAAPLIPVAIPGFFGTENVAGLAVTFPFVWFALAVPLAWVWREGQDARRLGAVIGALAAYLAGIALIIGCYFATTPRYLADFAPALGLLAVCGWLALERTVQGIRWLRRIVVPAAVVLAAGTVVTGALMSFDYHGRQLSRANAPLWERLAGTAHHVLAQAGVWLGQLDGPRVLKVRFDQRPVGTLETFWRAADAHAGERLLVEHLGQNLIRFGYERGGESVHWGRPLAWKQDHTHTVEVQVPSLYRTPDGSVHGLRRGMEFRERTSVAVRFSGGLALAAMVEPLPVRLTPGGGVPAEFSGTIRRSWTRVYRDDETGLVRPVEPDAPRGGALELRVILPDVLARGGEPLFGAGARHGSDMLIVRRSGEGAVFVFEHFGFTPLESAPFELTPWREHMIELVLPSFRPEAFGEPATGEVRVALNGVEILRAESACHPFPPGTESIGRNPFGTSCAPEFRGWILEAKWVGAAPGP
jgi:hypothetical protein